MLGLKSYLKLCVTRRRWRKRNGHNSTWAVNSFDVDLVAVGRNTYGGIKLYSSAKNSRLNIGSFCSIGPEVTFIMNNEHRLNSLSTFPFRVKALGETAPEALDKGGISIADDVWIGFGATILDGVHIAQGAVVGARALVTKDVPPYAIVGGCPAQVLRYRFSPEIVQRLKKIDFSKLDRGFIESHINDLESDLSIDLVDGFSDKLGEL